MQHKNIFIEENKGVVICDSNNNVWDEKIVVFLYIKHHTITKLKYFGKCSGNDPWKYTGSGKYWLRHIKKYGKDHVETVKIWSFNCLYDANKFALKFSKDNDIVNSKEWANLIEENALDGWPAGQTHSAETKIKISRAKSGSKHSEERRKNQSNRQRGNKHSEERRKNQSEAQMKRFSCPEERKQHLLNAQKTRGVRVGKKHYNNGIITKTFKEHPGDGWVLGRLKRVY
jgi:hypothetical protein